MGIVYCLMAAGIWGLAFVAQKVSSGSVGPWTFNATRFLIGFLVLLPVVLLRKKDTIRKSWKAGVICGSFLCFASVLQQAGIGMIPTGKAGFITSLYMVIVPFLQVATGRRVTLKNWLCIALAVCGLYLLCGVSDAGIGLGEVMVLACAFCFALQIIMVDRAGEADSVTLSCFQFLTAGIICWIFAIPLEISASPSSALAGLQGALIPILYTGIMSTGVAYTFQALGQRLIGPSQAVLPLSLESVFSAVFGFLILGEKMSAAEICGCAVVFLAVILSQIEVGGKKKKAAA